MAASDRPPQRRRTTVLPGAPTLHRSGAVARMLRMPVATLRVWERRYSVTQPAVSASGHRLYSADDVRRLALLKQLTDLGHAIGRLACLDMAGLQEVAATHARTLAATQPDAPRRTPAPDPVLRVLVIGAAMGPRLHGPTWHPSKDQPMEVLGPFEDAMQAADAFGNTPIDALLVHQPRLHDNGLAALHSAVPRLKDVPTAVLFRFAAGPVLAALATAGVALLREPQPDVVVDQWLQGWLRRLVGITSPAFPALAWPAEASTPRRWDDAALADFAGLSSTMACECPRHVAELIMQLSHFETYSNECAHRSPEDAALHALLQQVAAVSRSRFEAALEQVALHEGLILPPAP